MRILITNDDGITAPGLSVCEAIANDLAGPDGEVWVIAPAFEQSGVSHCISYIRPMRLEQISERRFAVEGSPADCVIAGLHEVLKDNPPDLVLSGVNRGHNIAEETLYSGTIGGAMEAALHGIKAIAMSQYYGAGNLELDDQFDAARKLGADACRRLLSKAPWNESDYEVFYNINFPPLPAKDALGIKVTNQGRRPDPTFGVEPQTAPNGRRYLWLKHGASSESAPAGTDAFESSKGWITVTPLRADLTAYDVIEKLDGAL